MTDLCYSSIFLLSYFLLSLSLLSGEFKTNTRLVPKGFLLFPPTDRALLIEALSHFLTSWKKLPFEFFDNLFFIFLCVAMLIMPTYAHRHFVEKQNGDGELKW